jgi:hypothetical protein
MAGHHRQCAAEARVSAPDRADDKTSLAARAKTAAAAELRGDRSGILGAVGAATLSPLNRTRHVPDRWSFYYVNERLEEGFRTLSRLPLPTRPRGYINSMPIYLYDRGDLNSQLETHELERLARMRNRVRIPPSPAEIARMEEALHWPTAHLGGAEFHHLARAVNLGALWSAFDLNIDERVKRLKITRRAFQARKIQGLRIIARELARLKVPVR